MNIFYTILRFFFLLGGVKIQTLKCLKKREAGEL